MNAVYRFLFGLYPYDFRVMFETEMILALEQSRKAWLAEIAALATGAASEWIAKLTTDRYVRARSLPDIRMMRPAGITKEIWFGPTTEEARCLSDTLPPG